MSKLYPPVIEGTIPAFNGTTLVVPFSMNRSVSKADIGGFSAKIKTIQSNTFVVTLNNGILMDGYARFEIGEGVWTPTSGQYYKLQLAYIANDASRTLGYYSTVGVVKYCAIDNGNVKIEGLDAAALNIFEHTYTGVYEHADDPMEKVYQYRFVLYKDDEIDTDSGWLLHDATADAATDVSVDTYEFLDDLDEDADYSLQYQVITTNELSLNTPAYSISPMPEFEDQVNFTFEAILDAEGFDNGYVKLITIGEEEGEEGDTYEAAVSGKFKIYRNNVKTPKRWEPIFNFVLQKEQPSKYIWKDFTVEHGETYRYKICQYNDYGIVTTGAYSGEVYVDFEDMFLFDGKRQLKVQFNPKISSFKNDILESKLDTIGSKYPFFFRNGHVHYKEFPISGLISYWMDNEQLFKPLEEMYLDDEDLVRSSTPSWTQQYQVKNMREYVRHRYWIVKSEWNEETQQWEDKSHWSAWTNWYDNGLIWTNPDYPHTNGEYTESAQHVKRTKHNERHEKEFKTEDRGWINASKEWIEKYNIPVEGYRINENKPSPIGNKQPPWSADNWGSGTQYAYDQHYKTKDLVNYNLAAEKKFKLDVLEWLTNGKPKLFRSPTEGNYIVRLMNTSLTPNDTVGRMLHTFQCTAYEIDDATYKNLSSYGFLNGGESSNTESSNSGIDYVLNDQQELRFKTVDLSNWKNMVTSTDGYVEVLQDPDGIEPNIIAQSLRIEDCEYGDVFYIDGQKIYIGVTGSYNLDNLHPIYSVRFKPSDIHTLNVNTDTDPFSAVNGSPRVTFSYFASFTSDTLFDNVSGLSITTEPNKQVSGAAVETVTGISSNLINDIQHSNVVYVTGYPYVSFERVPTEEIYTPLNMDAYASAVELEQEIGDKINALFTFDKSGWGKQHNIDWRGLGTNNDNVETFIKASPFCVFYIKPVTFSNADFYMSDLGDLEYQMWVSLDAYPDKTLLQQYTNIKAWARDRSGTLIPGRQTYYTSTDEEIIENDGKFFSPTEEKYDELVQYYNLTSDNTKAIFWQYYKYKYYLSEYMNGFMATDQTGYYPTKDTVRQANKIYYRLVEPVEVIEVNGQPTEERAQYIDMSFESFNLVTIDDKIYFDDVPNDATPEEMEAYIAYEYLTESDIIALNKEPWERSEDYVKLAFLYDFDERDFDSVWYVCSDGSNITFHKVNTEDAADKYRTSIFMNTGYTDGLTTAQMNELEQYRIDVADTIQPIVYYDLDEITDLYIGYEVFCDLSYNQISREYQFANIDQEIGDEQRKYERALSRYQSLVKGYNDEAFAQDTLDPTAVDYTDEDGTMNIVDYIDKHYEEYITAVTEYIDNKEREERGDE